jgi:putative ABC transport system substrate-binding protein
MRPSFLAIVSAVLFAVPFLTEAQPKPSRVGLVSHVPPPPGRSQTGDGVETFRQELQRLGYVDGQNLVLQSRHDGETGLRELLRAHVDVLVALYSPMALAAKRLTTSIPIVAVGVRQPVEQGLVQSLARPGANVTGIAAGQGGLGAGPLKRLEILKEIAPRVTRVAYLTNLSFPGAQPFLPVIEQAAPKLGVKVQPFDVRSEVDLDKAFVDLVHGSFDGVLVGAEVLSRSRIIALASRHRLPVVYTLKWDVWDGGLIAYDSDRLESFRRAARLVDRILKGAKPADLPFEQPTRYDLVINLKTAKTLGLIVPPSLLVRATEVIQ